MTTPKLLTCEEGDITLLSMNKEKLFDLDKTDLVPISRASVLLQNKMPFKITDRTGRI